MEKISLPSMAAPKSSFIKLPFANPVRIVLSSAAYFFLARLFCLE
jgi:hypothetical protein